MASKYFFGKVLIEDDNWYESNDPKFAIIEVNDFVRDMISAMRQALRMAEADYISTYKGTAYINLLTDPQWHLSDEELELIRTANADPKVIEEFDAMYADVDPDVRLTTIKDIDKDVIQSESVMFKVSDYGVTVTGYIKHTNIVFALNDPIGFSEL